MIRTRELGRTGIVVDEIGLGTVKLGRTAGVKYPRAFELPSDDDARTLLHTAMDLGINLVDTAPAYGTSEQRLGSLLEGTRDRWVIVTKAGEMFEDGRSSYDFSPEAIRASVERSLVRLRTDRVECVLLHSDGRDLWILDESGALDELRTLQGEGKALSVGISTKTAQGALRALETCDVMMATLNLDERESLGAIRRARDLGVGVLIKKALASGHARRVAESLGLVLGEAGVSCAVVGTINPEHLRENARCAGQRSGGEQAEGEV